VSDPRVWLITGASSGFGRAIADGALARGDSVVATSRRTDSLDDLSGGERSHVIALDAAYESAEMPEYAEVVGPTREYVRTNHGLQPGDPVKAAEAIIAALDADEPPLRLVLGADAIENISNRLSSVAKELAEWEELGRATAFEAASERTV
jgi:NAD(P)-dependent dehydrogenase (short-subunit alcohol dehydrogenase family)